jgi:hypothetical protein
MPRLGQQIRQSCLIPTELRPFAAFMNIHTISASNKGIITAIRRTGKIIQRTLCGDKIISLLRAGQKRVPAIVEITLKCGVGNSCPALHLPPSPEFAAEAGR